MNPNRALPAQTSKPPSFFFYFIMTPKKFPDVPKEAIVKSEDEKPIKTELRPEEVETKDEVEQKELHSVDHDMDGDGSPDT